jgi:hypothetical protein
MRVKGHNPVSYETRNLDMQLSSDDANLPVDPATGLVDYSKIKVGLKQLTDATIDFPLKKVHSNFADKEFVLRAIARGEGKTLKQISKFYFETSGIYSRLCRYMAYLYRYD